LGESREAIIKSLLLVGDAVRIPKSITLLNEHFKVTYVDSTKFQSQCLEYLPVNDILWIHVDSTLHTIPLESFRHLDFILSTSTGLTHFPQRLLSEFPNKIISLKGKEKFLSRITSTADLAITLILVAHTGLTRAIDSVKNTKSFLRLENSRPRQIHSSKLGIIGFGRLGRMVAERAAALGFQVGIFEIETLKSEEVPNFVSANFRSVEELVKWSHIISIHASSHPDSQSIVDEFFLSFCNAEKAIVNTARGNLVNENLIIRAIIENNLSLYLTDVLADEDLYGTVANSELLAFSLQDSRIIISPHIGGASLDAISECEGILIEELLQKLYLT